MMLFGFEKQLFLRLYLSSTLYIVLLHVLNNIYSGYKRNLQAFFTVIIKGANKKGKIRKGTIVYGVTKRFNS